MKAILYVNQFFGQIGGEDFADHEPEIREGLVGPALALKAALGSQVEITHTIICGDNFMGSRTEKAIERIMSFLEGKKPDIFFAGPAFRAGRYGVACGHICDAVQKKFNIPVITSMNDENPGVEMFRSRMVIFQGGASAAAMKKDMEAMAKYGLKILNKEKLLSAAEEGYFGRGIRDQVWLDPAVSAADRVIDMLLKKVHGKPFQTELPIPKSDLAPIAPAISAAELSKMEVVLITSGGIIPVGNPDRIQSASATRWGKYDISNLSDLKKGEFMTTHAGYDPSAANNDPDVVLPLDAMRAHEKEGKIGGIYKYFYSTVGTGTTQAEAARMAREIVAELKKDQIRAAILTST